MADRRITQGQFEKLKEVIDTAMLRFNLLDKNRNTVAVCPSVGSMELAEAWRILASLPECAVTDELSEHEKGRQLGLKQAHNVLLYRAANNWHGDPVKNARRQEENEGLYELANDILELAPETLAQWKSIQQVRQEEREAALKSAPDKKVMGEDDLVRLVLSWNHGHTFKKGDAVTVTNTIRALINAGVLASKGGANG